jgi:hypothetical protein
MALNPLLAQIYGTHEKIAHQVETAQPAQEGEQDVDQLIFDELQKTASAQGVDLNSFSPEELQEIFDTYKEQLTKEASAEGGQEEVGAAELEAIQAGDVMGRAAAHAFYAESAAIQEQMAMHEKLAGLSDEEILEGLAEQRFEAIVNALQGDGDGFMKEASMEITADLEEVDDLITLRAAELLDERGFSIDRVCEALEG